MDIYHFIKKSCLKTVRRFLVISIVCIGILMLLPSFKILHMGKPQDIHLVDDKKEEYVKVRAKTLCYSGYNLMTSFGKKYGYYYSLEEEQCVFALLPVSAHPKNRLHNHIFNAKVIPYNSSFKQMANSFAQDMHWDGQSLLKYSKPYILSNVAYHPILYTFLFGGVLIVLSISLWKIIQSGIRYFHPNLYPVFTFPKKQPQKKLLRQVRQELQYRTGTHINQMYITQNYFINLAMGKIHIIPLSEIRQCYRFGNRIPLLQNRKRNCTVRFLTKDNSTITVSHKTADETLQLINVLRLTEYDIIIGHSTSNQKSTRKRV